MSTIYSAGQSGGLRLDSEVLGKTQPWTVVDRGLEYPGEVIVAEAVDPAWGSPLEGDVSFRTVLYTVPRRIPPGQIRDRRIAMAVPRRSPELGRDNLSREILAVREAGARYGAGPGAEAEAVRASMEEREASLLGDLAQQEAQLYSRGRIYTHGGQTLSPPDIFVEADAGSWVERLVTAVYRQAYPSPPFEHRDFPSTLTTDTIGAVYRGIFQQEPEAAEVAAAFGPALSLSTRDAPTSFDAGACAVIDIIDLEMRSRGGVMPANGLLYMLCHGHGLNRVLATIYLLAYLRHTHADVELVTGHSLQLRQGGSILSDRISRDLLLDISFTPSMAEHLGDLRSRPSLDWNAALPYASLLVDGLRLSTDAAEIAEQQGRLLDALDDIARRIQRSREAIRSLATGLQEDAGATLAAIDQLQILCSATGYRGFHAVALRSFIGPSSLSHALDLNARLERLATLAPAITRARRYLDEMVFGREHQDLSVRRASLVARIGLGSLIGNPSLWSSVEDSLRQLRLDYAAIYLSHHERYHNEAAELVAKLDRFRPQVDALARFDEVPELGGPLGAEIPRRFSSVVASIRTCAVPADEVFLEAAPSCQTCLLPLSENVPRRQATMVMRDTERVMREYNRRLSSEGVRRVLANPKREQLDKFINLVQVSDLSALANVLDSEVVEFLRRFVSRG
jgi:hypothetical protein